jgi:hypothetical protein
MVKEILKCVYYLLSLVYLSFMIFIMVVVMWNRAFQPCHFELVNVLLWGLSHDCRILKISLASTH